MALLTSAPLSISCLQVLYCFITTALCSAVKPTYRDNNNISTKIRCIFLIKWIGFLLGWEKEQVQKCFDSHMNSYHIIAGLLDFR